MSTLCILSLTFHEITQHFSSKSFVLTKQKYKKRIHKVEMRNFGFILLLCCVCSVTGVKIQLFDNLNYSELIAEINQTEGCYNLPYNASGYSGVYSVITDTCFIAYNNFNCKAPWTFKYMPDKTTNRDQRPKIVYAESVQTCNDKEGGSQLNVDITTHYSALSTVPDVVESYHNVCDCINVPKYVQRMDKWSIDNHHNGLFAYFEPDCKEQYSTALYIDAGHWDKSRDMHTHKRIYKGAIMTIMSLGRASNETYFQQSCPEYPNDKIMKVELFEAFNNTSHKNFTVFDHETPSILTTGMNNDLVIFYAENNFQGFQFGSRSTSKCNNFPTPVQRHWIKGVGSIKTKTCVILYSENGCTERSVRIEAPGISNLTTLWESTVTGERTLSLLYTESSHGQWLTKSYHVCNNEIGGSSLDVDIFSDDQSVEPVDGPVILEKFRNLCACINVPEYVQTLERWSIDNHGNALTAYFSPNCSPSKYSPLWIPAGHSSYSLGLGSFKKVDESTGIVHKIQSFGPDPYSDYFVNHCNKSCMEFKDFWNGNGTIINIADICEFDTKSGCTKAALHMLKQIQGHEIRLQELIEEFQTVLKQITEIGQNQQNVALNLTTAQDDFDDGMEN